MQLSAFRRIYFIFWPIVARRLPNRSWHKVMCLLCLLIGTSTVYSTEAAATDSDETLYQSALDDLSQGNTHQAIEKLNRLVVRTPMHLGALLDLAIAYCQSDAPIKAEVMFDRLGGYFPQLPPTISELITYYRETCRSPVPVWRSFVAAGMGHADNLNQSPGIEYYFLRPFDLTLKLAESARPRKDNFRAIEAGISRSSQEAGWGGGVFFQEVDYLHANEYDTRLGQANVSYRHKAGAIHLEAQGIVSHLTLGGESYLTSLSTNLSAMLPLSSDGHWQFGGIGSLTDLNYLTLSDYRARIVEARGRLLWQPHPLLRLLGEVGWNQDTAQGNRPGGNRSGSVAQLMGQVELTGRQFLEFFHRQTWVADEAAYSQAFFGDEKRRPHQSSWYAAWRYQLPENFQLRLEARYGANRDTIPLFDYRSSSFGILLEWWPK